MKRLLVLLWLMSMCFGAIYALNDMPLLAQLQGEHNGSCYGFQIISLDFNHDSYDDIIILAAGYGWVYNVSPPRGKVYVYYGGPGFSSASQPAMTIEGDYPGGMQRVISSVRNVGDVSGDGFDDLLIGDRNPDDWDSTRYMFYYGGTSNLTTPDRIEIPQQNEGFYAIEILTDVDSDGFDDIGITYIRSNIMGFDIMWGGSFERQSILTGIGNPSYGGSIIGIGDVNNDGFNDFTIGYLEGDIGEFTTYQRLYYGNPTREFSSYLPLIQYFGMATWRCLPLGDLNGDNFDDFFVYASSNGLMIWYGSNIITPDIADLALTPVYYGNSQVRGIRAGDFNGDGFSDVVGASYSQQRFAVWLGSTIPEGLVDWQKTGTLENFGYDVAVGDFNGDGYDDIGISAPFEEGTWPSHDFRGYLFIYTGNPGMVATDDPHAPQLSNTMQMRLSPNPVLNDGKVKISLSGLDRGKGIPLKVEIYNLKGQLVQKAEFRAPSNAVSIPFDLSKYPSGVYICRASVGSQAVSKKFTIIK